MILKRWLRHGEEASDGVWAGWLWRSASGKRGSFLHRRLVEVGQRGIAVRSLGGNRAGEIRLTRFLRNHKVSAEEIVASASAATAQRVEGRHVLAIQDTTSLRDDGGQRSISAHPTIAVDAAGGTVLGLVHAQILRREGGLKARRRSRAFDDKQSRRWVDAAEAAATLRASGARQVTVIADRESDIYAAFARKPEGVELVVRVAHDRALSEGGRLSAHLAAQPAAGQFSLTLPARPGRAARQAELAVRFCAIAIKRPRMRPALPALPAAVALRLVEVREMAAPNGVEPICWQLLTTHRVESFAAARWVAGLYQQRWAIEELFRTLKTRGFDIERVAIADAPFEKLAAAALVAAVSVMQLVRERDGRAQRPLADVFEAHEHALLERVSATLEGKTQKQKNPHPKGSLAFASWVCARLGGWTGYYGKPGPIVILKGLLQFRAMHRGWRIAQNV